MNKTTSAPPSTPNSPQPPPPPSKQIMKGKKTSAKTKSKKRKRTDNTRTNNTAPTIVYEVLNNQVEVTLSSLYASVRGYIIRPLESNHLLIAQMQTTKTKDTQPVQGAAAYTVSSTADLQV